MLTIQPIAMHTSEDAVRATAEFDATAESALQRIVALAALVCDTPIAAISCISPHQQLLMTQNGLILSHAADDTLWCRHTMHHHMPLIINDVALDERFVHDAYVTDSPHIRFFAGVALIDDHGIALGALYVMDQIPRQLQARQIESLQVMAKTVITQLSMCQQHALAVEAINHNLEHYRLMFAAAATGIAKVSLAGRFLEVNDYIIQFLGYSAAELHHLSYFDITYADDLDPDALLVNKLLSGELQACSIEKRYVHKNGQLVWANLSVSIQHDANGVPLFFISVMKDITERKQLTAKIAAAAQQYAHILKTSADGFWVVNTDGYILEVNDSYCRISGYSRDQLLQMHVNALDANESAAQTIRHIQQVIAQGSDLFKTQHYRKDRTIVHLEVSATYLADNNTLICFLRDISDREQQQVAIINARISADLAIKRAALAERQIVNISEETSKRIGLELHDDLGQHLTGIGFALETLFRDIEEAGYGLPPLSRQIALMMDQAVSKTRNLAHGLYPMEITDTGLDVIFDQLARQISMTSDMDCVATIAANNITDSFTIINLYRIVQEAANNISRHSGATTMQIMLHDEVKTNAWVLEISDNGHGISKLESTNRGGLGMHTMHYRAMLIGATMEFISQNKSGSSVRIFMPKQITTVDEH
jgi:PAS domain S-box-containing protein